MSKYNTIRSNRIVNRAGGQAFKQSPKLNFVSLVLTSFVKDQFYRTEKQSLSEVSKLIDEINDPKFVAKTAIYARTKFGMRSISHVVAAEIAHRVKGVSWTKNFFDKVVYRPDDMAEILGFYQKLNGKKGDAYLQNALKKGFAKALTRFDEYQIAKYKGEGKLYSLKDIVSLVRPKATPALTALMKDTLKAPETWEAKMTKAGQKAETDEQKETLKAEVWKELLTERKLGYFALLRNLRNIIEQAPDMLPIAHQMLVDEKLIKNSLVLPFRYLTALEEISKLNGNGVRSTLIMLDQALNKSVANVPKFEGKTLVALDISSSMGGQTATIAGLFAAILYKSNDADFIRFYDTAEYKTYNPSDSVGTLAGQMIGSQGGTNFHAVFQEANQAYDRIVLLSDMQGWIGYDAPTASFAEYKRRTGANPRIYSFDLSGQGTMQFPENGVFAIAGFSDKVFDVMKLLEQDRQALVNEIDKIEL